MILFSWFFLFCFGFGFWPGTKRNTERIRCRTNKRFRVKGWYGCSKATILSPTPEGGLVNGPQSFLSSCRWLHLLSCSMPLWTARAEKSEGHWDLEKGKTQALRLLWDYCRKVLQKLGSSRLELRALGGEIWPLNPLREVAELSYRLPLLSENTMFLWNLSLSEMA